MRGERVDSVLGRITSKISYEFAISRSKSGVVIRKKTERAKPKDPLGGIALGNELVETTSEGIELLNDKYGGVLSADSPPIMGSFTPLINDEKSKETQFDVDYGTMPALRVGNGLLDRSITDFPTFDFIAGKPSYIVTDAEEITAGNGSLLIKVSLDIAILREGEVVSRSSHFVEGYVVLDPSRDWCLVEYRDSFDNSEGNPDSRQEIVAEFANGTSSSFHPVRIVSKDAFSDGVEWKVTEQFTELAEAGLPADEYYFSAYGLPEPAGVTLHRSSWIITVVLLVVISFLFTVVVLRRLNPRRRAGE